MAEPIYDIGQICNLDSYEFFKEGQPHKIFTRLRNEAPIYWHEEQLDFEPGFWAITKHEDIIRISKDPQTFSSARGGHLLTMGDPKVVDPTAVAAIIGNMIGMDPPEHQIYRKMVSPGFSPKAIRAMEDDIRKKVKELLENVSGKGQFNFVTEIAEQLPLWVLCEMMGIEESQRQRVRDLVNDLTDASINSNPENSMQVWVNYMELFKMGRDIIEERRKNPTDDLMSLVANTKVEGEGLPPELLDGFFLLMVIAGNETTRNTITGGMLALTENPKERQKLLKDPSLIANATEEMLRWVSPVIYFRRTATKDTEIRGQMIQEGEKVAMWYGAANRDEEIFEGGQKFRVDRENANKHLAFGAGQHLCLGNQLGKLQIRVMFEELLKAYPDMHSVSDPVRVPSNFLDAISDLQVIS
ncbi:MAG: cytochrome P450 [Gammaproteobacteria bacterium]